MTYRTEDIFKTLAKLSSARWLRSAGRSRPSSSGALGRPAGAAAAIATGGHGETEKRAYGLGMGVAGHSAAGCSAVSQPACK
jgi:hypothetical protein